MSLDTCIITIAGDGIGKYGKSKKDRTGPVRKFLVFNEHVARAVRKHLVSCVSCDPDEALREYRDRLDRAVPGSPGRMASQTFIRSLEVLDRVLKKAGKAGLDPGVKNEFYVRCSNPKMVASRAFLLSAREIYDYVQFHWGESAGGSHAFREAIRTSPRLRAVARFVEAQSWAPTDQELDDLVKVEEVMEM
jgi:hypothetical protein